MPHDDPTPPTESEPPTELTARRVLLADAAYCALSGAAFLGVAERVGRALEIPPRLVRAVGVAALAWAAALVCMARATTVRPWLLVVAVANALGALGIVALAATRSNRRVRAGVSLAALEVGGFAALQAHLLRRGSRPEEDGDGPSST